MEKNIVRSIDLFVHPFYKLSREAGHRDLTGREQSFLQFLEAKWKNAILQSKRKTGNLFVLIEYPLGNREAAESLERIKKFARSRLGKRFRWVSFSLSQQHRVKGAEKVSIKKEPFTGLVFSKAGAINITSWGESLGVCPPREARALQSALSEAGFRASVIERAERSVKEKISISANMRRMKQPRRRI